MVICLLSFVIGRYPIGLTTVVGAFLSKVLSIKKTWPDTIEVILFKIRLPRILGAMLIGSSLSLAGAVYQGMFKNPLISPDILGVSAGAAFGAVLAIYCSFNIITIQIFAFGFGILAVMFVYVLSSNIRGDPLTSLVIMGILISSIFTSLTSLIKYLADVNDKLPIITFWLMGSLSGMRFKDVGPITIPITVGIVTLYILRWRLNVLSLNEDEAKTLGLDTKLLRITVIICSTLITAASVSISGIIAWIGLVIPHFSRILVGPDYRLLIPVTIILGSSYLLLIDNIARSLTAIEIPLGILTSLVGAPFFIALLLKKGRG